jgi:glycosyltransferase involved in cell wall biosynthesis
MSISSAYCVPAECRLPKPALSFKILHVISSMDPIHGGPPAGIRQMSRALASMGHSTEVACLDRASCPQRDDPDLKIHALGPAVGKYHYSRCFVPWLQANVGRFDCVIAHDVWQYPCFATWRALRRSTTPYFVFTHGMLDPWFRRSYPLKHLKKAVYWRAGGHKVLRDARSVFFTTEEEKLLAGESFRPYKCKGVTVGFGTTGVTGNPVERRSGFLGARPELIGKKLLLFLGRITPKKGLDILIEAFARTAAKEQGFQLVIAGPENPEWRAVLERHALRLGVASRITWTGLLTDAHKWGAFYAADMFCLPSHQENFALGVAEALSCGLPVLISNKVNTWREIASARAGFVGDDDVPGTVRGLQRWLLLSANEQDAMKERARCCFERTFKIDTAAQALVRALLDNGVPCQSSTREGRS